MSSPVLAGPLPTALVVKCSEDGCPAYGPFSALPHALAGYGQHITSVTLNTAEQDTCPDWQPAAAFVRGIAVVCPNLTTLATDFPFLLPPPDLLTCLTHLTIELPLEGEWDEEEEDHTNEVRTQIETHTHAYRHSYTRTHTHAPTHVHMHLHMHLHMHTL